MGDAQQSLTSHHLLALLAHDAVLLQLKTIMVTRDVFPIIFAEGECFLQAGVQPRTTALKSGNDEDNGAN